MTTDAKPPIACTLTPGEFNDRLAWIADLTRDALLSHRRRDLALDLNFAREAIERVRELVRREKGCCGFLTFDLREASGEIHLTISAPEDARLAADSLFEHFVPQNAPRAAGEMDFSPQRREAGRGVVGWSDVDAEREPKAAGPGEDGS